MSSSSSLAGGPSDLSRFVQRELIVLLVLCAVATAAFFGTRAAAASVSRQESADAEAWYARGQASLADGRTSEAVTAFRRAVAGRRDSWMFAQGLVEALVADSQRDAARQVLLVWREREPGNAGVNAHLARLQAEAGDLDVAIDYYESALYGQWPSSEDQARLDLRRELIDYLLMHGEQGRALSHVLALSANQPDETSVHVETGRLFLAAGDPSRALDQFQRALRLDPRSQDARTGAGESAFALGDYARVLTYLADVRDEPGRTLARAAQAVLASDPLIPQLTLAERRRRLSGALDYARKRLSECAGGPGGAVGGEPLAQLSDTLTTFGTRLTLRTLRESPEIVDQGLRLVSRAIDAARAQCSPDDRDDIFLRVARRHEALEQ